jgi:hypothetical protein
MTTPKILIDPPAVDPAVGGLLGVANVIPDSSLAYHGVKHRKVLDGHTRTVPAEGTDKTFDQLAYEDGVEFATYRGLEVALLLGEDPAALAKDAFSAGETYAVEAAVQELLLNPEAVDITPVPGTGITSAKAALGLLEQWIADNYTGKPLIQTNRLGVELLFDRIPGVESIITVNGTPAVGCAGFSADGPGGLTADANEVWVYVTGQINLWQGNLTVQSAPATAQNRDFGLAERAYAATNSGPAAAILLKF